MGDTLDQREYFRDYCLTQKGKLLWDQIEMLHCIFGIYASDMTILVALE